MSNELKSVRTSAQIEGVHVSTEERQSRAIILDAKLNDALLDTFVYSAEIVDNKLYKELGFQTAKDYFEQKSISVRQAYTYAQIGRELRPHLLNGTSHANSVANIGASKLEQLVRHASDQIPALMESGKITLGDEEYTAEDLKETSYRDMKEMISKAQKKVEQFEVVSEQKKNAEMERDHLKKEVKDLRERDAKYRDRSVTQDQVEEDLDEISRAWEKVQKLITRIDVTDCPEDVKLRLVDRINSLQKGGERLAEIHAETLLIYNEHAPSIDSLDI